MNLNETLKSDIGIGLDRIDREARRHDPEGFQEIEELTKEIRDNLEFLYVYNKI